LSMTVCRVFSSAASGRSVNDVVAVPLLVVDGVSILGSVVL
jgi:hypothetical protein